MVSGSCLYRLVCLLCVTSILWSTCLHGTDTGRAPIDVDSRGALAGSDASLFLLSDSAIVTPDILSDLRQRLGNSLSSSDIPVVIHLNELLTGSAKLKASNKARICRTLRSHFHADAPLDDLYFAVAATASLRCGNSEHSLQKLVDALSEAFDSDISNARSLSLFRSDPSSDRKGSSLHNRLRQVTSWESVAWRVALIERLTDLMSTQEEGKSSIWLESTRNKILVEARGILTRARRDLKVGLKVAEGKGQAILEVASTVNLLSDDVGDRELIQHALLHVSEAQEQVAKAARDTNRLPCLEDYVTATRLAFLSRHSGSPTSSEARSFPSASALQYALGMLVGRAGSILRAAARGSTRDPIGTRDIAAAYFFVRQWAPSESNSPILFTLRPIERGVGRAVSVKAELVLSSIATDRDQPCSQINVAALNAISCLETNHSHSFLSQLEGSHATAIQMGAEGKYTTAEASPMPATTTDNGTTHESWEHSFVVRPPLVHPDFLLLSWPGAQGKRSLLLPIQSLDPRNGARRGLKIFRDSVRIVPSTTTGGQSSGESSLAIEVVARDEGLRSLLEAASRPPSDLSDATLHVTDIASNAAASASGGGARVIITDSTGSVDGMNGLQRDSIGAGSAEEALLSMRPLGAPFEVIIPLELDDAIGEADAIGSLYTHKWRGKIPLKRLIDELYVTPKSRLTVEALLQPSPMYQPTAKTIVAADSALLLEGLVPPLTLDRVKAFELPHGRFAISTREEAFWQPGPLIHHKFTVPEPRPSSLLSGLFFLLTLTVPVIVTIMGCEAMGVRAALTYRGLGECVVPLLLLSIAALLCWYWVSLTLAQVLTVLMPLSLCCIGVASYSAFDVCPEKSKRD